MVPFSSQGEQYWGVGGVGGLFGPPAKNFGMTSTTFFFTLLVHATKNYACALNSVSSISCTHRYNS